MDSRTKNLVTGAKVVVTLEVMETGSWGADCTIGQVHQQAADVAIDKIKRMIGDRAGVRLLGEPKVTSVSTALAALTVDQ